MAKKLYKAPKHITGHTVTTKTHFGSTSDMVVTLDNIKLSENEVICKDDSGYYITLRNRIDSGLADPNRYANSSKRIVIEEPSKEVSST